MKSKSKIDLEKIKNSNKLFMENNSIEDRDIFDDKRLEYFEKKIENWLENVETDEEKEIFLDLVKKYKYYNKITIANSFKRGFIRFKKIEPEHKDTIYMGVGSRGGVYNGSSELMPIFKRINEIDKLRIADKPKDFYGKYDLKSIKNIVLIDDIIGSGTTVKRYIDENLMIDCPEIIFGKKIYVICVIASEKAVSSLKGYYQHKKIPIEIIFEQDIVKTFDIEKGLFTPEKTRINARKIVKKYDTKLARRKEEILGFKESQALVSFYHNTPNNTFPIFWQKEVVENNIVKVPWTPLLERDEGIEGLPERSKPTHENLKTIIKQKKFKKLLLNKIFNIITK
ncbi:phosphoribosyltransferase [Planococcus glaciei]|uniref:phosphoribosyltransferase n=1 Tax=Planococcus glaciei TaxID=459472 RepID=UPI001C732A53|nr:hypothetical protein [Planococcus glaciei]MBX0315492.1 hypothetical protein [Planococcus glaciei]